MVKEIKRSSWLLAGGLVLALASRLPPIVRSQDPPEEPVKTQAPEPDDPAKASGDGEKLEEPPAPSPEGEKPGTVPAPGKAPGKEDEGPRPSPRDDELALRVLEIEQAIWREVESVESRLRGIKERLRMLRGRGVDVLRLEDRFPGAPPSPLFPEGAPRPLSPGEARQRTAGPADPDVLVLPGDGVLFSDSNDEISYLELLRRQDDVLRRWRRIAPPPDGRAVRRSVAGEKERAALREELRGILGHVLDLREKARERQIEGLRREIDDIERAIDSRREGAERGRLIERRLEDLLIPRPEPSRRRPPE